MKPERGMVFHTERKLEGHPDAVLGPRKKAGEEERGDEGEGKQTLRVHTSQHLLPPGICPCHTSSVYFFIFDRDILTQIVFILHMQPMAYRLPASQDSCERSTIDYKTCHHSYSQTD